MVKRGSKTVLSNLMGETNATVMEMAKKMLAMEKEIGRLRHHVSVLSKRELVMKKRLLSVEGGKGKEEMVGEVAGKEVAVEEVVAEAEVVAGGSRPVAEAVAEAVAGMDSGELVVPDSVTTRDEDMEMDNGLAGLKDRLSDEDVVMDGKIVSLKGYTPVASGKRVRRVEASPPRAPLAMVGRGRGRGYLESAPGRGGVVFGVGIRGIFQGTYESNWGGGALRW